ncbi:MAG: carboxymuconolactone decarboxylase family protein [Burkholderiales bacterium]|nr:carboxymuconolactone decarboxylase family protein [Burkholderiales bacterium]
MSRITLVDHRNANAMQKSLLDAIRAQEGRLPNYLKVLANSPVALQAFLGLRRVAEDGSLSPQTRERIALALAQYHGCEYSLAIHTALGRAAGLTGNEMAANRAGSSEDAKAAVAVELALSLSAHRGAISNAELFKAREAGLSEADIVEIITHVGMNLITAMIGKASQAEIDFPKVDLRGI